MKHLGNSAWVLDALEDRRLMSIGPLTIPDGSINDSVYDPDTKTLHVVYLNSSTRDLMYQPIVDNDPGFAPPTVIQQNVISVTTTPQLGSPGLYVALAQDDAGLLHVAYFDATKGDLIYARRALNGTWSRTTVDAKNSTGLYPSIVIKANSNPAISYFNKTSGDLKLADFDGTNWNISVIASTGEVGRYSSLRVHPVSGRFAVAYNDDTNGDVKYAEKNPSAWSFQTVDANSPAGGSYISLNFNSVNRPAIAYCDTANADLEFAERSSRGKWSTQTLAAAGEQGFYADLAYHYETGQPDIVFYNRTADRVDLTYRNPNGTWTFETQVTGGGQNLSATDAPSLAGEVPPLFLVYSDKDLLKLFVGTF